MLILATGAQITGSHSGKAAASTTTVVLVCKTLIPATVAVILGLVVGIEGNRRVSILAMLAIFGNSRRPLAGVRRAVRRRAEYRRLCRQRL